MNLNSSPLPALLALAGLALAALTVRAAPTLGLDTSASTTSSPHAFYDARYPHMQAEADALFEARYGAAAFGLDPDAKVEAWDGSVRTVPEHFQWMKNHIREYSRPDAPGFVKQGEKDGVVYELHTEKTREGGGAGYFRLTAEIELDPLTFVALMGAPHKLFAMDDTVRVMDFERSPKYPSVKGKNKLWLAYFRQAPGGILPDLDGIDLSGWEVAEDGSVLQASMGLPKLLPEYPGKWYPSAFRSLDMYWGYSLLPLAGGRSKLVLICQHDLQNWMVPHYFANKMVGDVLADYVRTAERVGQGLVQTGKAAALRERHGL